MKNKAGFWDDVTQALANGAMFYLGYSLVAMDTDIQDALYDIFFQYREQESLSKEDVSDIKNKLLRHAYGVRDGAIEDLFVKFKKN